MFFPVSHQSSTCDVLIRELHVEFCRLSLILQRIFDQFCSGCRCKEYKLCNKTQNVTNLVSKKGWANSYIQFCNLLFLRKGKESDPTNVSVDNCMANTSGPY